MDTKVWELGLHQIDNGSKVDNPRENLINLTKEFNIKNTLWIEAINNRASALNKLSDAQKEMEEWFSQMKLSAPQDSYWGIK